MKLTKKLNHMVAVIMTKFKHWCGENRKDECICAIINDYKSYQPTSPTTDLSYCPNSNIA